MAEHLDTLLPLHHLLDVAVHTADRLLLFLEIKARFSAQLLCDHQHEPDHHKRQNRQRYIHVDHSPEYRDDGHSGVDRLGNALADQLSERIHIICVNRHDISVGVGVKILDGQGFHGRKQADTQIAHGSLSDIDHNAVVKVSAEDTDRKDRRQLQDCRRKPRKIRVGISRHGRDIVVDQHLHKGEPLHIGDRRHDDADYHHKKRKFIIFPHILKNSFHIPLLPQAFSSKSPPPFIWVS